jgi:hypothetical protein
MMAHWKTQELAVIRTAVETEITAVDGDSRRQPARPIWVVRRGGDLYIRSNRGPAATTL